jgi:hypothetical protein
MESPTDLGVNATTFLKEQANLGGKLGLLASVEIRTLSPILSKNLPP